LSFVQVIGLVRVKLGPLQAFDFVPSGSCDGKIICMKLCRCVKLIISPTEIC